MSLVTKGLMTGNIVIRGWAWGYTGGIATLLRMRSSTFTRRYRDIKSVVEGEEQ